MKKGVEDLKKSLEKGDKIVAMFAPSFVVDFSYPKIILQLKELGFEKVVELTFGAKMINRDYREKMKKAKKLVIASVCPGIVQFVKNNFPEYEKNIIKVDSPMVATGKICKKFFSGTKTCFIGPCDFKKAEAIQSKYVDFAIDFQELKSLIENVKIGKQNEEVYFDKFYNDYTKVYPITGGLSKTAHFKGILDKEEYKIVEGVNKLREFLEHPKEGVKFLDVNFCKGGCIGGPKVNSSLPVILRKRKVLKYLKKARKEDIPEDRKGLVKQAEGISFVSE